MIDAPVNEVVQYMAIHERRKEWDKYLVVSLLAHRQSFSLLFPVNDSLKS